MSPLFIVLATVLSIVLYCIIFMVLVKLFYALVAGYRQSRGGLAFVLWILAAIVFIPVFILDTIHTIICLLGAINMASSLRDWWASVK